MSSAATDGAAAPAADLAILVRGLKKTYPPAVEAVRGIDLEIRRGECFGLLGPNGAGKTTTVEILEGLLDPTDGEVELLGMRWSRDADALRARLGVSLQQTNLPDRLTVREVLALFRSFFPRGRGVEEVMRRVSLEDKRDTWYQRLSGGQKQRLAVACALVGDPEILFLDEPTTGLDPQSRRQLWDLVVDLKRDGRTVLLTTHYMDEAERLCDRVAVVDQGRVVSQGTPAELIARLGGSQVIELACEPDVAEPDLEGLPTVHAVRRAASGWVLSCDRVHEAVPPLVARLAEKRRALTRLGTRQATLEDVFVALTGRHLRD